MNAKRPDAARIGIDLGGTNTRVALIKNGKVVHKEIRPTRVDDPVQNLAWVVTFIKKQAETENLASIGIAVPGLIDFKKGAVLAAQNIGSNWRNFSLTDYLGKALGLPVYIDNDANVQALYHATYGLGKGHDVVQFFTISTGIGAGLAINGKVLRGEHGFAQEIANLPLGIEGASFGILAPGAIEAAGGGAGMRHRAEKAGIMGKDAKALTENYKTDKRIEGIVNDAVTSWAKLFATTIGMINPGVIVIGGGVAANNPQLVSKAVAQAEAMLFEVLQKKTKYVIAAKNDDAGLIGASALNE